MTDRPIPFRAPMIRALLDGRKTQTRWIIKPQPTIHEAGDCTIGGNLGPVDYLMREIYPQYMARFRKGDRLWVREAWRCNGWASDVATIFYRASEGHGYTAMCEQWPVANHKPLRVETKWSPSLHLPRWASRLTLTVTDVRVQRLQEISEADCIAEGATERPNCSGFDNRESGWCMDWSQVGRPSKWASDGRTLSERDVCLATARLAFGNLFDRINGSGAWDANPWIVALSFTVERRNIDA